MNQCVRWGRDRRNFRRRVASACVGAKISASQVSTPREPAEAEQHRIVVGIAIGRNARSSCRPRMRSSRRIVSTTCTGKGSVVIQGLPARESAKLERGPPKGAASHAG